MFSNKILTIAIETDFSEGNMKILIQRTKGAFVEVENKVVGKIDKGMLVLVGVEKGDSKAEADWLAKKTINLRIFEDENGKMNLSVKDVGGKILAVSQFTLAGDCSRGNRPGFDGAAEPKIANELYVYFMDKLREEVSVESGIFQADMQVHLVNDGPVTFILNK